MDISVGAIGAAVIGASISLVSLIITKESKVSEFRQAWIDALRADIAEAIGAVSTVFLILNGNKHDGLGDAWKSATTAMARVDLRLNILEEDHRALERLLRETETVVREAEAGDYDREAAEDLQDRVVVQSRLILKREWDRVRVGEPTFQAAKWLTAGCLLLGSIAWLYWRTA